MDVELDLNDLLGDFSTEVGRLTRRAIMAEARAKAWERKARDLQALMDQYQQVAREPAEPVDA